MKFTTFYFSGTGNTEWVVRQFGRILGQKGQQSELYSIEQMDKKGNTELADILQSADYIGFASPIYGGNLPPVARQFINRIKSLTADSKHFSKPIYFIHTFAYINGFGPICTKRLVKGTGFQLMGYANVRMCNNISSPKMRVKNLSREELEKRKAAAESELTRFADKLITGKKYIKGIGPYLLPNIIIRRKTKRAIQENYKVFSVNHDTCRKCMVCMNHCPTKSIRFESDTFTFLPTCTACMRCYNHCPTCSILFDGQFADPKIYKRYPGPENKVSTL